MVLIQKARNQSIVADGMENFRNSSSSGSHKLFENQDYFGLTFVHKEDEGSRHEESFLFNFDFLEQRRVFDRLMMFEMDEDILRIQQEAEQERHRIIIPEMRLIRRDGQHQRLRLHNAHFIRIPQGIHFRSYSDSQEREHPLYRNQRERKVLMEELRKYRQPKKTISLQQIKHSNSKLASLQNLLFAKSYVTLEVYITNKLYQNQNTPESFKFSQDFLLQKQSLVFEVIGLGKFRRRMTSDHWHVMQI